jgi:F-type H+-transporting ATPase subunit a
MEQFEIKPLFDLNIAGYDLSFTNSAMFMTFAVVVSFALFWGATRKRTMVPGRWQSIAEILYEFNAGMVTDNIGPKGMKYLPFVFTLFLFVLLGNVMGLMPYGFTITSHIVVTATLAVAIWVGATIIGFSRHGLHYFSLLLPKGTPLAVAPFLVLIETMSYFIRPVSLSLRLFANMMAGHVLLKVLAGFIVTLGLLFGWIPLVAVFGISLLEIMVALIQAYVFALLTCIYLNDAVNLH